jgi:hypothetical protein
MKEEFLIQRNDPNGAYVPMNEYWFSPVKNWASTDEWYEPRIKFLKEWTKHIIISNQNKEQSK